jgi:uncharacterized protein (DUF2384 family)
MQTHPAVLTKAVLRAAEHLELSTVLPAILGMDAPEWARIAAGERMLDPAREEWQNAVRFAGLFRSLLSLVGTPEQARVWLATAHKTLGAAPVSLLQTPEGRDRVYRYLDAVQKYEIRLPPRGRVN